jgi:hypothetical protein
VQEVFGVDVFIIDRDFGAFSKPYVMRSEDGLFSNTFRVIVNGYEVGKGMQIIHDPVCLQQELQRAWLPKGSSFEL